MSPCNNRILQGDVFPCLFINQLIPPVLSEQAISQSRNLVSCSYNITQVVTSHKRAIFDGSHSGWQFKRTAQATASTECTLSDAFQTFGKLDAQQIFFWVNVYSGITVVLLLLRSTATRLGI